MNTKTHRPISEIAMDIMASWEKPHFAAAPYLHAMLYLNKITDPYYMDSGESVVRYFLSNARTFKGEEAKALKAELKAML